MNKERREQLKIDFKVLSYDELIHRTLTGDIDQRSAATQVLGAWKRSDESNKFKTIKFIGIATLLAATLVPIAISYYENRKQGTDQVLQQKNCNLKP